MDLDISRVGKRFTLPSSDSGSFREELRELLWTRGTRALWIGFAISAFLILAERLLLPDAAPVVPEIMRMKPWLRVGHPASFGLALAVLYLLRERACVMKIQLAVFFVFAVNIVVITLNQIACRPGSPDFFSLSLLLFIPAAFVPWKAYHQLLLGAAAVVTFVVAYLYAIMNYPEMGAYWEAQPSGPDLNGFLGISTIGIATLSLVSFAISRTLYTLNKTSHAVANLGNYIVEKEIGEGGMGKVLLARHRLIRRPTAVKVLQETEGDPQIALARFEREVRLSANLTHPNTIQIYDFGRSGENVFYYAMEYLSGMDLQRVVERFGPLPPERVVFLLKQACGSLAEAHAKGVVHRDIKPSNLFLTERGGLHDFVKVLDFGLAKRVSGAGVSEVTRSGMVFGTPRYISPEALYGDDGIDGRSDLYNLGGVAYWLLTGKPPFDTSSSVDLIIDHVKTVPPRPSEVSETPIPRALEDVVMRLLEKKADDRYRTAEELGTALTAVAKDLPATWTWKRARDWWQLHGLDAAKVPECW
ncbi:serine/threonine protein kinase [bacterium]|nr:serine/threonine protein kinase [bacterium]